MLSNQPIKFLVTSLFVFNTFFNNELTAAVVSSNFNEREKIISKAFVDEIVKRGASSTYYLKNEEIADIVQEKVLEDEEVEEEVTETVTLGKGESAIERQKQKIREQLAEKNKTSGTKTGKDKIKEQLEKNKQKLKDKKAEENIDDIYALAKKHNKEMKEMAQKHNENLKKWNDEYQTNLQNWAKQREIFLKNLPEVKKNLEAPDLAQDITRQIKVKKKKIIKVEKLKDKIIYNSKISEIPSGIYFVKGALELPVKDQAQRATCSSFAGIRAIEILLQQMGQYKDLSEQYFYWASKPKCRTSPCSQQGSWAGWGYDYSMEQRNADIPVENNCPYVASSQSGNESQIPLGSNCNNGEVKVVSYDYVDSLANVQSALMQNLPVIASLKLTENFYTNTGMIFESEIPADFKSKDKHAEGHSVLLIGVMELAPELRSKEGKICFITANSWGEGWGKGGHGCISEKWLNKHKSTNPFIVLKKVQI